MPEPRAFTDKEKLQALQREIGMRRKVYPGRVVAGKMTPEDSDWEIAIMEAIAQEYRKKLHPDLL